MNKLDKQYLELLEDILENGVRKEGRNGVTYSVLGRTIRHDMREGFPLLTTKKMYWKGIVTELLWFLSGSSNIQSLVKEGNYIWVGDAYKYFESEVIERWKNAEVNELYEEGLIIEKGRDDDGVEYRMLTEEEFIERIKTDDEFAEEFGDMGPIYGKQWRDWGNWVVDELERIYENQLTKLNGLYSDMDDEERLRRTKSTSSMLFAIQEVKQNSPNVDQIQNLLDTLKTNPDSRRMRVSAWNVGDLDDMKLPPCHYGFTVSTRELTIEERLEVSDYENISTEEYDKYVDGNAWRATKYCDDNRIPKRGISLIWSQRSVDTPLGLPFNIASYGLLLEMIANEMNMVPLELIGHLEDVHIYENQIEGVKEQLQRNSHPLPTVTLEDGIYSHSDDIHLENYKSEGKLYLPLSN